MEIAPQVRILAGIQRGSVYYFEEEGLSSDEPHFFIVLNRNPRSDEFIVLVCASSQIEKRKETAKKLGFPQETLVFVSPQEYKSFSKETVIDCNKTFEKNIQSLVEKLESGKLKVCVNPIPENIIMKLIQGVLVSPRTEKKIIQLLSQPEVS